jgi:hypothetical protein
VLAVVSRVSQKQCALVGTRAYPSLDRFNLNPSVFIRKWEKHTHFEYQQNQMDQRHNGIDNKKHISNSCRRDRLGKKIDEKDIK